MAAFETFCVGSADANTSTAVSVVNGKKNQE
jgi:hypothetical protein